MPITREFTIRLQDRPGALGKLCQALAEEDVNILAYQQFPHEKVANRSGELARAASRLGDQGININYSYSGAEPGANASFLILGVADAGKAVKLLEQAAAAGTTT